MTSESTRQELINTENIVDIIKFKQEINETIDAYIELIKNGIQPTNENLDIKRLVVQIRSYYDRMKAVYSSQYQSDDDDEIVSDSDNDDYTEIMRDRVYINPNNIVDKDLIRDENKIRRQLLGLDMPEYRELDNLNDDENLYGNDSSVDPPIYGDENNDNNKNDSNGNEKQQEIIQQELDDGDYITRNTKQKFKITELNSDIIVSDEKENEINYDDPIIKTD